MLSGGNQELAVPWVDPAGKEIHYVQAKTVC